MIPTANLPRIPTHIQILRIPPDRHSLSLGHAFIDGIRTPERVRHSLMICESLVRTRLECHSVTFSLRVEHVRAGQNAIDVFARTATGSIRDDVRIGRTPVSLQEAEDLRGL